MARRTRDVVIGAEGGRDAGKHYIITEMAASRAERWAMRALAAMMRADVEIPDNLAGAGMAGLAAVSLKALSAIPQDEVDLLMAEMMSCVSYVPDPSKPMVTRTPPWDDDIEEVRTRLELRRQVIELHTGFSLAADPSTSGSTAETTPLARAS
jgi:hypothetical protein